MGWDDHDMILYTILTNWLAEVGVVAKETHGPYQRKSQSTYAFKVKFKGRARA